ncbi:hypothetical protein LJB88_01710 [Erysipelotrichaceae bacterium OttesenSCG-928-M19]|nr:hypothetical protein [Erysipelotrichaceae bacterium OttesenSCG-928-M19]
MKKILLSLLCFAVIFSFLPQTIDAKTYNMGKGYRMVIHAPNSGKKYHHVHVYSTNGRYNRCYRLDNFKECDKGKRKGAYKKWVYDKIWTYSTVMAKVKIYHKAKLKLLKKKVPRWAWYAAAGLTTVVAITTTFFPVDDAVAISLWKLARGM